MTHFYEMTCKTLQSSCCSGAAVFACTTGAIAPGHTQNVQATVQGRNIEKMLLVRANLPDSGVLDLISGVTFDNTAEGTCGHVANLHSSTRSTRSTSRVDFERLKSSTKISDMDRWKQAIRIPYLRLTMHMLTAPAAFASRRL